MSFRIALTSEVLPGSARTGAAYANHRLANELVKAGHSVTVVSLDSPPRDAAYRSALIDRADRWTYPRLACSLSRFEWSRFDIVLTTGADVLMPRRRTFAWVRLFHGSSFEEARHAHDAGFVARMLLVGTADTVTMLRADARVAISESTKRWHPRIDRIIPNAVDRAVFRPGPKSLAPSLLFVGGLGGRKRGGVLRDLFRDAIRPVLPEAELWLVLADREVEPRQGERVFHNIAEDQLADLYRSAWVYGSLATYEGFGIPYVEAMASGTSVISAPNAGAEEIGKSCTALRVVPLASFPSEVVACLSDRPTVERLGSVASRESEQYGWGIVVSSFEEIFDLARSRR